MNDSRNVFIAVMGTTGAGKSTFIKVASGDDTVGIGHTLKSCKLNCWRLGQTAADSTKLLQSFEGTSSSIVATTSH